MIGMKFYNETREAFCPSTQTHTHTMVTNLIQFNYMNVSSIFPVVCKSCDELIPSHNVTAVYNMFTIP